MQLLTFVLLLASVSIASAVVVVDALSLATSADHQQSKPPLTCYTCSSMQTPYCRNLDFRPQTTKPTQTLNAATAHNQRAQHSDTLQQQQQQSHNWSSNQSSQQQNNNSTSNNATSSQIIPLNSGELLEPDSLFVNQLPPVKTRECTEEEPFCLVTSIVRLEFVNNSFVTRFWALERNCSRSCNTACMMLGERVRLRVCGSCCTTPNCNTGGAGAAQSTFAYASSNIVLLTISLSCYIVLANSYR